MNHIAMIPSPLHHLADNSLFYAFEELSLSGIIICVSLFVLSCFSWSVMITKFRMILKARRQTEQFTEAFRDCKNPLNLYQEGTHLTGTPLYNVYMTGAAELAYQTTGSVEADETFHARLTSAPKITTSQMDSVGNTMDRAIGESVLRLESKMTILATAVSGAPFLGLLGTVWGVMDTFTSVASAVGATSLKTLAPGVSSALLTTVTGLVVAIPAMFGYNYLVNNIKSMIATMENFANEVRSEFERHFLDHGSSRDTSGTPPIPARIAEHAAHASEAPSHAPQPIHTRRVSASELVTTAAAPSHRVVRRVTKEKRTANTEFAFDEPDRDGLES
jgi:biopolymer transport protein TolQ